MKMIETNESNYGLYIINEHNEGLGLRIKAGSPDTLSTTGKSLAILSVADKDNDNKLIVKASGQVVVFNEFEANRVVTNKVILKSIDRSKVPMPLRKGMIVYDGSIPALCFYDGQNWHKLMDEIIT
tara:strand:- start:1596 stop:1973 length:378 start_codon:yes stop_codon:yes gene_type:complete